MHTNSCIILNFKINNCTQIKKKPHIIPLLYYFTRAKGEGKDYIYATAALSNR